MSEIVITHFSRCPHHGVIANGLRVARCWPQPAISRNICRLRHPVCTNRAYQQLSGFSGPRVPSGLFRSPCLATGGASMGDMYSVLKLPYLLAFWVAAATCGPALVRIFDVHIISFGPGLEP